MVLDTCRMEEEKAEPVSPEPKGGALKSLDEYNANLLELLRKVRAEKRLMRDEHQRAMLALEDEVISTFSKSGAFYSKSDGDAKLKEEIGGLRRKLKSAEEEVKSVKEQMALLFNTVLEMNPPPKTVDVVKVGISSVNSSSSSSDSSSSDSKVGEAEAATKQLEEEQKKSVELEMEVASLKKINLLHKDQLQSMRADRDAANDRYEALEARVGSADGADLSMLRKKHRDEVDRLTRRLAKAQIELQALQKP